MYEELIQELRIYRNDGLDELCCRAADAIEELLRKLEVCPVSKRSD